MVIYCEMHPIKTLEKLNYQRLTTEFTDVTVTVAGQQFSLHKSLLASYSSLFCSVFQEVAIGESAPNINLDGVGVEFFSIIIDFIYTSKLDATPTNIDQLLTAAQFLQMPEVIDLCNEYKKKDIEDVSQNNSKVEGFTQCEKQNTINSEVSCEEKIFFPVIPKDENGEVRKKQNLEQVANMMVEVYQSSDGSFAKEDESINKKSDRNYPGLVYTRAEIEEAKKTSRRGPRLQTRITCQVCNKSFTRQKYEVHKRTHTGEKPYQCTTCEKQFVSIYNLRVHERIHTGERPYRCNQCNKTFSDPSTVTKHMSMHEGVKNKKCDLCGKLFATLAKVREHRRTHTKEKPFVCPDCGKAYGYRCDLKRHMREHTGDLIGPCPDCGKCFNHKSNYLSHVKTHVRKSNAPQLKIQDSGLMISDGRMILKAKIDDGSLQGMLMMPEHESMSDDHGNATNVALQETIASGESEMGTEQIEKLSNSEDDGEIEVTINNGKLYVKHSNGAQSSTILDGSRIILKDENLSVDTTNSSSQCGTSFSADQVLMLVQHAQGIDMSSSSMQQSKDISLASENVHDQLMDREENTLVVVSEDI